MNESECDLPKRLSTHQCHPKLWWRRQFNFLEHFSISRLQVVYSPCDDYVENSNYRWPLKNWTPILLAPLFKTFFHTLLSSDIFLSARDLRSPHFANPFSRKSHRSLHFGQYWSCKSLAALSFLSFLITMSWLRAAEKPEERKKIKQRVAFKLSARKDVQSHACVKSSSFITFLNVS